MRINETPYRAFSNRTSQQKCKQINVLYNLHHLYVEKGISWCSLNTKLKHFLKVFVVLALWTDPVIVMDQNRCLSGGHEGKKISGLLDH